MPTGVHKLPQLMPRAPATRQAMTVIAAGTDWTELKASARGSLKGKCFRHLVVGSVAWMKTCYLGPSYNVGVELALSSRNLFRFGSDTSLNKEHAKSSRRCQTESG